jgi:hypothetical protein
MAWGDGDVFIPNNPCTRHFSYRGAIQDLDSGHHQDGEGLKPIIKGNAEAEHLLADYQAGTKTRAWLAYTGSAGVAIILGGIFASPHLSDTRVGQRNVRFAFTAGGVATILGSYLWGRLSLNRNEDNLKKAVDTYNKTAPSDKRISWGVDLVPGGTQLKTEVSL